MSIFPDFFASFLLTTFLSFFAPILLVGGMLSISLAIGYIPGFAFLSHSTATPIWEFLTIFGSGCPVWGILTIGFACGVAGALFDLFNFYRYQSMGGNRSRV